jgi:hypothetical protein
MNLTVWIELRSLRYAYKALGHLECVRRFFGCGILLQVSAPDRVGGSGSISVIFEIRKIPERPNIISFPLGLDFLES